MEKLVIKCKSTDQQTQYLYAAKTAIILNITFKHTSKTYRVMEKNAASITLRLHQVHVLCL